MASVRVEGDALSDPRFAVLAKLCGLADCDHARGKVERLWFQCTNESRYVLSIDDVETVLGTGGAEHLVRARLGAVVRGGVRICGTKGRIEWLKKLRNNGKKGGRPRKPEGYPSGSGELNPPITVPVTAPSPVLSTQISESQTHRGAGRKALAVVVPDDWSPDLEHVALAAKVGRDVQAEADRMRDWARAGGHRRADWNAVFRNWLRNDRYRTTPTPSNGARPLQPAIGRANPLPADAYTVGDEVI